MDPIELLAEAIESFEWAGPGNTVEWIPGENADDDELAKNVIDAAIHVIASG